MKNISELFLPYELAKIAKFKHFEESCLNVYDDQGFLQDQKEMINMNLHYTLAPLYQQIVDFFRTVKGIEIRLMPYYGSDGYFHGWSYLINEIKKEGIYRQPMGFFEDYYISMNEAIKEAFKLI